MSAVDVLKAQPDLGSCLLSLAQLRRFCQKDDEHFASITMTKQIGPRKRDEEMSVVETDLTSSCTSSSDGDSLRSSCSLATYNGNNEALRHDLVNDCNNDDRLYRRLRDEALDVERSEPDLSFLLRSTVLHPSAQTFEAAAALAVVHRIENGGGGSSSTSSLVPVQPDIMAILNEAVASTDRSASGWTVAEAIRQDALVCVDRDPACQTLLEAVLFFKGFAALTVHRAASRKWNSAKKSNNGGRTGGRFISLWLQATASERFGVDIHPGATIGAGIMLDHATGIVVGETAVIGDGCSLLHGVTLGGTGKESGVDRHPKVGNNVLIGAGSSILGNISIGEGAKIGAGAIVLRPIPCGATAVGAPAKIVRAINDV